MRVEVKDMDFGYDEETPVLHEIDLVLDEPGLVCIIGPNGVGKSTLIKCMNRLLTPTSGSVTIDGRDVGGMSYKELSRMLAYVPVSSNDYFPMTVVETVMMGRHPLDDLRKAGKDDFDAVYDVLSMMHIEHLAMRSFGDLSAGQHQRVAIARGLAQEPKLLILDEPTANLDVRFQMMISRMLRDMAHREGMTVLMISHDLNIASRFADRVILMTTPGVIYREGTPEEVVTRDNIRYAYGVDCEIIERFGRPHVILLDELSDEEMLEMHGDALPEE